MGVTTGPVRSEPVPPFRRMMIFADGENLVCRYQRMLKDGLTLKISPTHIEDVLVWSPGFSLRFSDTLHEIFRAAYYTSSVGDDPKIKEIENKIKSLEFKKHRKSSLPNNLTPCVFKKAGRSDKAKGVDIQMTVDILNHVHRDNIDTVLLMSGDGDYLPVIEEVQRYGKQCYVSAFSSGLNDKLKNVSDMFVWIISCFINVELA
jgi:uncharacterized LabA/DUF88 family protein